MRKVSLTIGILFFIISMMSVLAVDCLENEIECNNQCVYAHCTKNSDCDDTDFFTKDQCLNMNTCDSKCVSKTLLGKVMLETEGVYASDKFALDENNKRVIASITGLSADETTEGEISGEITFEMQRRGWDKPLVVVWRHNGAINSTGVSPENFDIAPVRLDDDKVVWVFDPKNFTEDRWILIRYNFDSNTAEYAKLMQVDLENSFSVRKENPVEYAVKKITKDSKAFVPSRTEKMIYGLIAMVIILVVGMGFYFGRNEIMRHHDLKDDVDDVIDEKIKLRNHKSGNGLMNSGPKASEMISKDEKAIEADEEELDDEAEKKREEELDNAIDEEENKIENEDKHDSEKTKGKPLEDKLDGVMGLREKFWHKMRSSWKK